MNCRKVNSLLSAYMDGELAGVEQLQIRSHLRDCRCCSDEYESLLLTKRMISGASLKAPRSCLEDRILDRINDEKDAGSSWHNLTGWWSLMAESQRAQYRTVALFAVFCALAGVYVLNPFRRPVTPDQLAKSIHMQEQNAAELAPASRIDDLYRYQIHSQAGEAFGGPAAVPASFHPSVGR